MTLPLQNNSAKSTSTQIQQFYAREILAGRLPPGSRLPSSKEMAALWKTSIRAVHTALGGLVVQGLIERKQRRGTFVRDSFESSMIGVLVAEDLIADTATFFRVLCSELQTQLEEQRFACRVYDNLLDELTGITPTTPSQTRFLLDQKVYDFKGYIYIGTGTVPSDTAMNDLHPRAVHLDAAKGVDAVWDMDDFLTTTVSELARRGYKRIGYLRVLMSTDDRPVPPPLDDQLTAVAAQCGIPKPTLWDFWLTVDDPDLENQAYQRLMDGLKQEMLGAKDDFPEVIIITDDVIARALVFALREIGFHIPSEVQICTLASDGVSFFYGTPVYQYRFPTKQLAASLIRILLDRMINVSTQKLPVLLKGEFLDPFSEKTMGVKP